MSSNCSCCVDVYLGLGSNLGDRRRAIESALDAVDALPNTDIVATSALYETKARFVEDQPDFLNACTHLETSLAARRLLDELLAIEEKMGRIRTTDKGPRTIDLDILLYGDRIIDRPGLTIPHPDLHNRRFVLEPLVEIAADVIHPRLRCPICSLLDELDRHN